MGTHKSKPKIQKSNLYKTFIFIPAAKSRRGPAKKEQAAGLLLVQMLLF